ncbi:hypothetical protein [Chitinimonas sp. BJB300]|uniref:hypothetical protein n=1 Tax=Chitinimonas sp. BJB300 TaxID=1559339 RepID=UPI000C0C88D0|nr:hypothetical protein [Chitinimonas sp. BJB300]PHV12242.1 hypothetical protein CSQ89_06855 [Chitinimonas sp. BJB300]TSJ85216.1 hypothetical protein FG002_018120 [Chitinimonas sp. BJB300]
MEQATTQAKVGEYDGHEVDANGATVHLYLYGPSADRLFETVKPILNSTEFVTNPTVKLRYGPPKAGVKQKVLDLKR